MTSDILPPLQPLHKRILGCAVPLRVFEELYGGDDYGFLYESIEGHGGQGRYSFLGGKPRLIFRSKGDRIDLIAGDRSEQRTGNPLHLLRELVQSQTDAPPVATFPGGAVGYLGYDMVRFCEKLPDNNPDDLQLPDSLFIFPQEIIVLDHLNEVVHILLYQETGQSERIDHITRVIADCRDPQPSPSPQSVADAGGGEVPVESNMTQGEFEAAVRKAKEYILAGDVFQVVLSQRMQFPVRSSPLELYKSLRLTNPSPYMYYLNLDGLNVLGSSPEILVKLAGRHVVTRPLAGTRPRGATKELDDALARELAADPKERAEHVMLVDLSRNDIGRVCRSGTIEVANLLDVERYARVMHLVSDVQGKLRDDMDAFDLFESSFPAGTVSGAPKIRAMEIIDELEPVRRGIYAGAIGYFSFLGDMDLCIAIRTLVVHNGTGYLQAGAGIVADSDPRREYEETLNKARAVLRAIHLQSEPDQWDAKIGGCP